MKKSLSLLLTPHWTEEDIRILKQELEFFGFYPTFPKSHVNLSAVTIHHEPNPSDLISIPAFIIQHEHSFASPFRIAIDVGSNNLYVLIMSTRPGNSLVYYHTWVSALSRRMKNHFLTHAAIHRLKKLLHRIIPVMQKISDDIIITGTSCSREAGNSSIISNWLAKQYNLSFILLSEYQESKLLGLSTHLSFPDLTEFISFDIGGGSTEFSHYKNGLFTQHYSAPIGLRRLQNAWGSHLSQMEKHIDQIVSSLPLFENNHPVWIGTGLTTVNLLCLIKRLERDDLDSIQGYTLTRQDLELFLAALTAMSQQEFEVRIAFEPQRKSVIQSAILLILSFMTKFRFDKFRVNNFGLSKGLMALPPSEWNNLRKNHAIETPEYPKY